MSNRLEQRTRELRARGQRALAPYVTAGDGGLDTTLAVLHALDEARVACIELGFPFSDPIADGPVLQAAAQRALEQGTTFEGVLAMVAGFRASGAETPIVAMGYVNTLARRGWTRSLERLARAGVDGVLAADLPVEEAGELCDAARAHDLCPIFFASPTSSAERIARSVRSSRGFLYTIPRTGVTGRATDFDDDTARFLTSVREFAGDLALGVGFGIRTGSQVRAVAQHADLAIVGSALVERVARVLGAPQGRPERARAAAREFVSELEKGLSP